MVSDMYKGARDAVKPGAKAGDIYDGSNKIYRQTMGADYFRRVGGSMGLAPYAMSLSKGAQEALDPGVALVVQPLVNEPVLITCCSTVLVTETGREELTTPLIELKTV
jgi:Xaa-Pro aminopeptidase